MSTHPHDFERADERQRGPIQAEIRARLDELARGAMCNDCRWQRAVRVWRGRLWCLTCAKVAQAVRSVEIVAEKIHRSV